MLSNHRLLAVLLIATLAIYFWGLGSIPLLSFNEARRGVPVQEMLASGDWLVPTLTITSTSASRRRCCTGWPAFRHGCSTRLPNG